MPDGSTFSNEDISPAMQIAPVDYGSGLSMSDVNLTADSLNQVASAPVQSANIITAPAPAAPSSSDMFGLGGITADLSQMAQQQPVNNADQSTGPTPAPTPQPGIFGL